MLASKVAPTNSAASASGTQSFDSIHSKTTTKPVVEQKDNSTNEILEAALHDKIDFSKYRVGESLLSKQTTATSSINATDPKNAKKRKLLASTTTVTAASSNASASASASANATASASATVAAVIPTAAAVKSDNQHLYDCESGMCKTCDGKNNKNRSETTSISNSDIDTTATRRSKSAQLFAAESASLDDILDFIEGNTTSKKDSQKKAAKKAKQKQKKEDVKRVEELEQLRDQFHEAFFKELDVKNDLKNLRSMKKRDKKKIADLETSIKKYGKFKSKIEANILELIGVLKKNNLDFKFAYLPTKEQQLDKQKQQQQQQSAHTTSPVMAEMMSKLKRFDSVEFYLSNVKFYFFFSYL